MGEIEQLSKRVDKTETDISDLRKKESRDVSDLHKKIESTEDKLIKKIDANSSEIHQAAENISGMDGKMDQLLEAQGIRKDDNKWWARTRITLIGTAGFSLLVMFLYDWFKSHMDWLPL